LEKTLPIHFFSVKKRNIKKKPLRICLTEDQKEKLQKIIRSQKAELRLFFRASIILQLAEEHLTAREVAQNLNTSTKTVKKWQNRFLQSGIAGLSDLPRSGAPTTFNAMQRCEVIAIACDTPEHYGISGYTKWTNDLLTEAVNQTVEDFQMSRSSIVRTLKDNELKPHKMNMWLHSRDPQFKEKVNDIVSLYLDPPEDAVILSIDEKTGMQATERKHETKRPIPGKAGRYEYEYIRHGTLSMLTSFDIKTGKVYSECGPTRTGDDLIKFMENVAKENEYASRIVIIWDNLNIHHDGPSKRWTEFNQNHGNKFEFHYTPLHASWVNQVEIFFSILQKRSLKHGSFCSTEDLKEQVMAFIKRWNEKDGHPFNWTFRGYPMQSQEKEAA
jgi:transposase